MTRCMEIEWKGNVVFCHKAAIQEWKAIVQDRRLRSVRRLEGIDFGPWTAIYEVEIVVEGSVWRGTDRKEKAQYLVEEFVAHAPALPAR